MKKLAFIVPWYGRDIPGGAEMELRVVTQHLSEMGISLEILTTCVKDFNSDWSKNYYKARTEIIDGIPVRRFAVRKRDAVAFHAVNAKLMKQLPVSVEEEEIFLREMVNSPKLYQFISKNKQNYDLFIFIPYMFGTTYYGVQACLEKAVMIPCFHDEGYLYLNLFKELFPKVKGFIYNAQPEYELANRVYNIEKSSQMVAGIGMDVDISFDGERFREKFAIRDSYILYAGRKDSGKNIYTLLNYFSEYKKRNNSAIKLVLIGGGEVKIPESIKNEVIDLGFVDVQDKYDACSEAVLLCQPSKNESFSFVIMESWLCGRPVLVHEKCNVTRYFASCSNGGLYFDTYFEFEGCLNYILDHPDIANKMGQNGRNFVIKNFSWKTVIGKYINFFERLVGDE